MGWLRAMNPFGIYNAENYAEAKATLAAYQQSRMTQMPKVDASDAPVTVYGVKQQPEPEPVGDIQFTSMTREEWDLWLLDRIGAIRDDLETHQALHRFTTKNAVDANERATWLAGFACGLALAALIVGVVW